MSSWNKTAATGERCVIELPLSGKTSRLCTEIFELSLIHSLSFPDPFPVAAFIPPLTEWAFSRLFCNMLCILTEKYKSSSLSLRNNALSSAL